MKAIDICADYVEAHYNYALLLESDAINDYENAKKHYEISLGLDSNFPDAFVGLGNLLMNIYQDFHQAKDLFERAIKIDPNKVQALIGLGASLMSEYFKDFTTAKIHLKHAINIDPSRASAYINLGGVYLIERDYELAEDCIEKALELEPKNGMAQNNLMSLLKNGLITNRNRAISIYKTILSEDPQNYVVMHNLAVLYSENNDYKSAISILEKELEVISDNESIHEDIANLKLRESDFSGARYHYEMVLKINPQNITALKMLALLEMEVFKKMNKASEYIEHAYTLEPDNEDIASIRSAINKCLCYWKDEINNADDFDAHLNTANFLQTWNDIDGAIEHCEKALKINPNHVDVHLQLGSLLKQKKHYKEALEQINKALQINPNHSGAHNNLALLLKSDYFKDYDEAKKHFETSLVIEPNASTYCNLAVLLESEHFRNNIAARDCYEKALELEPENEKINYNFANFLCLTDLNDKDLAIKYYEKALDIKPDFIEAHLNYAKYLVFVKQYRKARIHFEKVLDINPNDAETYYELACILIFSEIKEYDTGKDYLKEALKLKHDFENAHYVLAVLLINNYNQYIEAKEHLDIVLKINPSNIEAHKTMAILLSSSIFNDHEGAIKHLDKVKKLNRD